MALSGQMEGRGERGERERERGGGAGEAGCRGRKDDGTHLGIRRHLVLHLLPAQPAEGAEVPGSQQRHAAGGVVVVEDNCTVCRGEAESASRDTHTHS